MLHTKYFQPLGQLRKGGRNYHFRGTFENKKILIKTICSRNILCIHNGICQTYETEKLELTPRRPEEEDQIDFDPEQLKLITQKQQNMPRTRGDSLVKTHCEARRCVTELQNWQNLLDRWK